MTYYDLGKHEDAAKIIQKGLRTIKQVLGEKHPLYSKYLMLMGLCLFRHKRFEEAL